MQRMKNQLENNFEKL